MGLVPESRSTADVYSNPPAKYDWQNTPSSPSQSGAVRSQPVRAHSSTPQSTEADISYRNSANIAHRSPTTPVRFSNRRI
jgi:hypothetical protein